MAAFVVTDSLKQLDRAKGDACSFQGRRRCNPEVMRRRWVIPILYIQTSNMPRRANGAVSWPRRASPDGLYAAGFDMFKLFEKLAKAGAPMGLLDGGVEYDFLAPIGAGDILIAEIMVAGIEGRETKMGPTMVTTLEIHLSPIRGELLC